MSQREDRSNHDAIPALAPSLPDVLRPERDFYEHPRRISYSCDTCPRTYLTPHHLALHARSCDSNKRKVSQLLEQSKDFWEMRKRRRLEQRSQAQDIHTQEAGTGAQVVQQGPTVDYMAVGSNRMVSTAI